MLQFFFFFFKQKTAYELRISDWSSDVCSSDLLRAVEAVVAWRSTRSARRSTASGTPTRRAASAMPASAAGSPSNSASVAARDRKSVVEGESVSVRVDLGGRRIIKKKKEEIIHKANRDNE